MNIRQRYRRYRSRCRAYNWHYMRFREWYGACANIQPGKYGYA